MFGTTQKSETIFKKSVPSSTPSLSSNAIPNMGIYEKSSAEEPGTKVETTANQCPEISTQTSIRPRYERGKLQAHSLSQVGGVNQSFTAG